jgi:Transposase DDE domain
MDELARQRARELADTPELGNAQRQRKKVEALFADLKHQIGLRRLRLRRLKFLREEFFLSSSCAEHQATGAVPQPTDKPCGLRYCLAEAREENFAMPPLAGRNSVLLTYLFPFFNTHRPSSQACALSRFYDTYLAVRRFAPPIGGHPKRRVGV